MTSIYDLISDFLRVDYIDDNDLNTSGQPYLQKRNTMLELTQNRTTTKREYKLVNKVHMHVLAVFTVFLLFWQIFVGFFQIHWKYLLL